MNRARPVQPAYQKRLGGGVYFTEMCGGSEDGSHFRLIDLVYHSTLGSRVIKKKSLPRG